MENSLWNRYNTYYHEMPSLGMSIDISRMRFPGDFFKEMAPKISSAFASMNELEKGAIANPDEGRMVGHYWLRNAELAPNSELKNLILSSVVEIKKFSAQIHNAEIKGEKGKKFTRVLVVGIGGSALGPQLGYDALGAADNKCELYFCDNTDPDGIEKLYNSLKGTLDQTLVLVISKSGGTVETRNGMLEIAARYKLEGLNFAKHAVAITGDGSKLDQHSKAEGWLKQIYMWDWVGGRTSLFSAVGLVPLSLLGADIDEMLVGAGEMDKLTRVGDATSNPAMLLALMWYYAGNGLGKKDMVVLPYKDRLVLFSKYLQQLVMESIGKEKDLDGKVVNQGIAVYGNKGSTDQHAYIQQLRDGLNNFFAVFIRVLEDVSSLSGKDNKLEVEEDLTSGDYLSGFYQGTRKALYENGRDSITITVDTLNAKSLGALIALFERAVGYYASFVNINAYHQPGVEAGKKAATRVVEIQKLVVAYLKEHQSEHTVEAISAGIKCNDDVETVYLTLEHLVKNSGSIKLAKASLPKDNKYSYKA
jgi:glucose-6-phosphate isomerase